MTDIASKHEHKQQMASSFNLVSTGYDNPALRFLPLCANRLVELAGIHSGQKILDVATGTGTAAIAAARAVGESGQVVGVDIAKDMREKAQQKISQAGLKNVEIQEADGSKLHFSDNSFDTLICASAIYCLPDILAGLREWQRVTKPGGRVAFSSFGEKADKSIIKMFEVRLRSYGVPLPHLQLVQRINTPEKCGELLQKAGFEHIEVHTEQLGYYLLNVAECWDIVWNSGFRMSLSQLEPEKLEQFRAEYLAEVGTLATDQGIWLDIPSIFALSRKPADSALQK